MHESHCGFLTFFFDHGSLAAFDTQTMRWWTPEEWRSDDDGGLGLWFHIRDVPPRQRDAVAELCGRFIQAQAEGALIPEGYGVRLPGVEIDGSFEAPRFNRVIAGARSV